MQLLTNSRIQTFKTCRKQAHYSYELGIRRAMDGKALRMGTAYHLGLEAYFHSSIPFDAVVAYYSSLPTELADSVSEIGIEEETVLELINGYLWRWEDEPLDYVVKEQEFRLPLRNPDGGRSTIFELAGKIDGIVALDDGRLAVVEHKLLGDDIGPDSELWRRLRLDQQISLYVLAARDLGFTVDTVLYDVARKPTIKPCAVPLTDANGEKIVTDPGGNRVLTKDGRARQTGDTAKGYTLQTRPMDRTEWAAKLREDIGDRPSFYYARVEIPRLDADLEEFRYELWDVQKSLRDAQNNGRWYRTATRNTCQFCSYFDLCSNPGVDLDRLPEGFVKVENIHPELGDTDARPPTSHQAAPQAAASAS